jgi:hypothetical protein
MFRALAKPEVPAYGPKRLGTIQTRAFTGRDIDPRSGMVPCRLSRRLPRRFSVHFEEWCRIVGGILEFAGISGFLGNLDELYRQSDPTVAAWEAFLGELFRKMPRPGFKGADVVARHERMGGYGRPCRTNWGTLTR